MARLDDYERIEPQSRADWRAWLAANHERDVGVWLVYPRKASGLSGPSVDEAVEEALCFGWIDSLPRKLDAARSMLLFAPRKRGSGWSAVNKARVARLIEAGLMQEPGLAAIASAKADGSWIALDGVGRLEEPPDLLSALEAEPAALSYWNAFPKSARRGILEWIGNAKTAATREKRIAETIRLASDNIRANQWRQPGQSKKTV